MNAAGALRRREQINAISIQLAFLFSSLSRFAIQNQFRTPEELITLED